MPAIGTFSPQNHMKNIQVGLLGIGTVGSGVFNVLQRNFDEIQRRAGRGIAIKCKW
jgi:homoserine dehydrogenase